MSIGKGGCIIILSYKNNHRRIINSRVIGTSKIVAKGEISTPENSINVARMVMQECLQPQTEIYAKCPDGKGVHITKCRGGNTRAQQ